MLLTKETGRILWDMTGGKLQRQKPQEEDPVLVEKRQWEELVERQRLESRKDKDVEFAQYINGSVSAEFTYFISVVHLATSTAILFESHSKQGLSGGHASAVVLHDKASVLQVINYGTNSQPHWMENPIPHEKKIGIQTNWYLLKNAVPFDPAFHLWRGSPQPESTKTPDQLPPPPAILPYGVRKTSSRMTFSAISENSW